MEGGAGRNRQGGERIKIMELSEMQDAIVIEDHQKRQALLAELDGEIDHLNRKRHTLLAEYERTSQKPWTAIDELASRLYVGIFDHNIQAEDRYLAERCYKAAKAFFEFRHGDLSAPESAPPEPLQKLIEQLTGRCSILQQRFDSVSREYEQLNALVPDGIRMRQRNEELKAEVEQLKKKNSDKEE